MPSNEKRFRFVQDDDAHWYLIEASDYAAFNLWLRLQYDSYGEWKPLPDDYAGKDFEEYRVGGGPETWSFTDPKRDD